MATFSFPLYSAALPEIFLAAAILATLMLGVFWRAETSAGTVLTFSRLALASVLLLVWSGWEQGERFFAFPKHADAFFMSFSSMFVADDLAVVTKIFLLAGTFLAFYLGREYLQRIRLHRFEFYVLHLLAVLGMMLAVSAHDFLSLYLGMEMMSLSLYLLSAFRRESLKSSEAGLKYFVLGSLASCIFLYGVSLLYGVVGDTSYTTTASLLESGLPTGGETLIPIAMVLVITGLAFKVSAVPFHMWTPDVYQGAPTPVTTFMATVVKLAAFVVLARLLFNPFLLLMVDWQPIIILLSMLTIAVGALLAIVQENIKRLLAYSSITHAGFILLGLAAGTEEGVQGMLFYLVIYALMTFGAFSIVLCLRKNGKPVMTIADLAGLNKVAPGSAAAMAVAMFSMAGVPPLAGFFAKLYVFKAVLAADMVWLAVLGVLFSVVAAYYSLKVIKAMYFDAPPTRTSWEIAPAAQAVGLLAAFLVFLFGIFPTPLVEICATAAASLF